MNEIGELIQAIVRLGCNVHDLQRAVKIAITTCLTCYSCPIASKDGRICSNSGRPSIPKICEKEVYEHIMKLVDKNRDKWTKTVPDLDNT